MDGSRNFRIRLQQALDSEAAKSGSQTAREQEEFATKVELNSRKASLQKESAAIIRLYASETASVLCDRGLMPPVAEYQDYVGGVLGYFKKQVVGRHQLNAWPSPIIRTFESEASYYSQGQDFGGESYEVRSLFLATSGDIVIGSSSLGQTERYTPLAGESQLHHTGIASDNHIVPIEFIEDGVTTTEQMGVISLYEQRLVGLVTEMATGIKSAYLKHDSSNMPYLVTRK
ncbi:MAG: hypothetical protein M3Q79_00705 [bacterium]|nr:hypothetical protein [bacterium]